MQKKEIRNDRKEKHTSAGYSNHKNINENFRLFNRCLSTVIKNDSQRFISAKGKIEIQLRSFENQKNRDETGRCCSKSCSEKCSPFVRICLKQYQTIISDFQNCTYGGTVIEWDDTKDDGQKFKPLSFPFHFVWTGDLTFIIEVWHAPTGFKYANPDHRKVSQQLLLLRKAQRKTVAAGDQWTQEIVRNSFSRLELQYRVSCDENYYGKDCAAYCKPRDDTFGHYSCSPVGRKVCVDGWRGEACNEAGTH
uniref:Delta-like protein n=1 Tax=Romanomermis culicivorax TaxID=13658 RepID=A0A915HRV6_ROMCU